MRAAWSCRQGWITEQPPEEPAQLFLSNGKQCTINTQFFHFTSIFTAVLLNSHVVFQFFFIVYPQRLMITSHMFEWYFQEPWTSYSWTEWVTNQSKNKCVTNLQYGLLSWSGAPEFTGHHLKSLQAPLRTTRAQIGTSPVVSSPGFSLRSCSTVCSREPRYTKAGRNDQCWNFAKRTDEGVPSSGSTLILFPTELSRVVRRRRGTCLGTFDGE